MLGKQFIVGALLLAGGLLTALPGQAGIVYTFKNTNDINTFVSGGGHTNMNVTWDSAGKMVCTSAEGVDSQVWMPFAYAGNWVSTASTGDMKYIAFRVQVSNAPHATGNVGSFIFHIGSDYYGKSFTYNEGDQVVQVDLSTPDFSSIASLDGQEAEYARIDMPDGADEGATAQVTKFDWIIMGEKSMLADVEPFWFSDFTDEASVASFLERNPPWTNPNIQLDCSWADGGFLRATALSPYDDPEMYYPITDVPGSNRYLVWNMDTVSLPDPSATDINACIIGFKSDWSTLAKNINFHPGRNLMVQDPSMMSGSTAWRDTTLAMVRVDPRDEWPVPANMAENFVVDYDYLAIGPSILWMLEREYPGLDTDSDGVSDTKEIGIDTDLNNPDSDGEGLTDGEEVNIYGTDPNVEDTDGDSYTDKEEVDADTDPLDADEYPGNVTTLPAAGLVALSLLMVGILGIGLAIRRMA